MDPGPRRATWEDVGREPFRVFFPAAAAAGILGASLWPLYFIGWLKVYPSEAHARIMADGMFGGFIVGFLGTALPRLLGSAPLGIRNVLALAGIHALMVVSFLLQRPVWGDSLMIALLLSFISLMLLRVRGRTDLPPPGFILVLFGLGSSLAGAALGIVSHLNTAESGAAGLLPRLLSYQAFVLFPILGIGPFILPRFFGQPSRHAFPEMVRPSTAWFLKLLVSLAAGLAVLASFFIEAHGGARSGNAIRFAAVVTYMVLEFPFQEMENSARLARWFRVAFGLLAGGYLLVLSFPESRVPFNHVTFIGGFAVITLLVASRVVFGHSGRLEFLQRRRKWIVASIGLMLSGMITRITGDFWPKILPTHYSYGALMWILGFGIWAAKVLPHIREVAEE